MRSSRLLTLLLTLVLLAGLASPAHAARTHVVKSGETLSTIAAAYGVSTAQLARANKLRDADLVRKGQKLLVPDKAGSFIEHRVARGESLDKLAKRYRVTVAEIRAYNVLRDPDHIVIGQVLRIPVLAPVAPPPSIARTNPPPAQSAPNPPRSAPPPPRPADPRRMLPAAIQAEVDAVRVAPGRWQHIVIHHSATDEGSGKGMDRYHREERHMENGLAYHFAIGNGNGMPDGEIYVSKRWREQLDGGHLAIPALNANSLGICLVGDFQKSRPTTRQLDALEALIRALERRTGLGVRAVTTHKLIHKQHTQCPGRHFPTDAFIKRLKQP
jgi:LysM repeat protein